MEPVPDAAPRAVPRLDVPAPDPADWRALRAGALLVALPDVGHLRLTGADRRDFLHGQLAHDVRGLPVGGARRSLQLDVKGHALAEAAVHVRDADVHLAVEDGAAEALAERLRRHVVFDDVEIASLAGVLTTLTLQGPRALEVLEAAGAARPEAERFVEARLGEAAVLIARHRRSGPGGVDVQALARDREAVTDALRAAGATLAVGDGAAALEASRVAAGLPRAGTEAGAGVLPQEAGLEDLLSTRKGCYLGQEIMARLEARGRTRRGLALLALEGDASRPSGTYPEEDEGDRAIRHGDRVVGRLGTVVRHPEAGRLALAVLRHDVADDAELRAAGGRARRRPLPPPGTDGAAGPAIVEP